MSQSHLNLISVDEVPLRSGSVRLFVFWLNPSCAVKKAPCPPTSGTLLQPGWATGVETPEWSLHALIALTDATDSTEQTLGQIHKATARLSCDPHRGRKGEKRRKLCRVAGSCRQLQVAAALHQTHMNVFKLVMMRKMTPPLPSFYANMPHCKQRQIHKDLRPHVI